MADYSGRLVSMTAQIVSSYLAANKVEAGKLSDLIRGTHQSLADLGRPDAERAGPSQPMPEASINPRKSVFADHLICLSCGLSVMMLKRHLRTAHQMTPEQYRTKWSLPGDYPMVTREYAKIRSKLAKASGLGRKDR